MNDAALALLGVLLGVLLSEFFRRRSRIESYAQAIFEKRLAVYEELFAHVQDMRELAPQIVEKDDLSPEDRKGMWDAGVLELARLLDKHALYVDDEIAMHAMLTMVGLEKIHDETGETRNKKTLEYQKNAQSLVNMIRVESGLKEIDRTLKDVARAAHSSDHINFYRRERKKLERQRKKGA